MTKIKKKITKIDKEQHLCLYLNGPTPKKTSKIPPKTPKNRFKVKAKAKLMTESRQKKLKDQAQ